MPPPEVQLAKGPSHNTVVRRAQGTASIAEIPAGPINLATHVNLRTLIGTRWSRSSFSRRPAASRVTLTISIFTVG